MKTEFKAGAKVWDDVLFPGIEGVVTKIDSDRNTYPVEVFLTASKRITQKMVGK